MITQRYLERDGERLLLRLAVAEAAVLDVLTDAPAMARARAALEAAPAPGRGPVELRLGTFGPFDVTLSAPAAHGSGATLSVDGPDLGRAFRGTQVVVFYVGRDELIDALRAD